MNKKILISKQTGFTLIELLVVIGIISILSALLLSNFVGVRQRGRDGQRKSDLSQLQSAFELYRADNGLYPDAITCGGDLRTGSTIYMKKIPCDPQGATPPADPWKYNYNLAPDKFSYTLYACLENNNDSRKDTTTQASCGTYSSYTLTNP